MKRNKVLNLQTLLIHLLLLGSPMVAEENLVSSFLQLPASLDYLVTGAWSSFENLLDTSLGDSRPEIVSFKQYLAQFGYLDLTGVQNVSDLFDPQTLAALELYQKSFGLPASGKVDMRTLFNIMMPRCGREDVTDGIPLMLPHEGEPTRTAAAAMAKHEEVKHYSFFPSRPRWPESKTNLTYAFKTGTEMGKEAEATDAGRREAIAMAFREWERVIPLRFKDMTEEEGDADIVIEFALYAHGDGKPFDGAWGVLAHAFSPPDGRMHMDGSEDWHHHHHGKRRRMAMDLQTVATHEVGHLLGLSHSGDADAVMYPSVSPGQIKRRLRSDDIAGAQILYGANNGAHPAPPKNTSPRRRSSRDCSLWLWLSLVMYWEASRTFWSCGSF